MCRAAIAALALLAGTSYTLAMTGQQAAAEIASAWAGVHTGHSVRLGRSLLQTSSPQCVYSPVTGTCAVNPDFFTTLAGTPTTDSQKYLARTAALTKTCSAYTSQTTCLADASKFCDWCGGACVVSNLYSAQYLNNVLYCPDSNGAAAAACLALSTSSSCNGNTRCQWFDPAAQAGLGLAATFGSTLTGTFSTCAIAAAANTTGLCMPKWLGNATYITGLITKALAGSLSGLVGSLSNVTTTITNVTSGGSVNSTITSVSSAASSAASSLGSATSGLAGILGPIFTDLFGTCSSVTKIQNLIVSCGTITNATACRLTLGCDFSGGSCGLAQNSGIETLLNATDPWVAAWSSAAAVCDARTSATTCAAAANITGVDTTKYTSFATVSPSYATVTPGGSPGGGAAGMASVSFGMVISAVAGLLALFAFLA